MNVLDSSELSFQSPSLSNFANALLSICDSGLALLIDVTISFSGQWIWVSWQCGKYSIEVEVFKGSTFNTGLIQHPGIGDGGIQLAK